VALFTASFFACFTASAAHLDSLSPTIRRRAPRRLTASPLPSPPPHAAAWTTFGAMTPEDDAKDAGPNIKIIGRWSDLAGGNGVVICETDNPEELAAWGANWVGQHGFTPG